MRQDLTTYAAIVAFLSEEAPAIYDLPSIRHFDYREECAPTCTCIQERWRGNGEPMPLDEVFHVEQFEAEEETDKFDMTYFLKTH